jgi:hypothetical protein
LPNISEIRQLFEATISKEELLRKENLVPVVEDTTHDVTVQPDTSMNAAEISADEKVSLAERYEEIVEQIDSIKIKSPRQISDILQPVDKNKEETKNNSLPQQE